MKNGLGRFKVGERSLTHAFDGFAKMTSFDVINATTALFSSQFIATHFYNDSLRTRTVAPYITLGAKAPRMGSLEKVRAISNGIDNTNVNIYSVASQRDDSAEFLAVSDFWHSYKVDPRTCSTLEKIDPPLPVARFLGGLVPLPSTAHPVRELGKSSRIGFVIYLNPIPGMNSQIHVIRIHSAQRRDVIATFDVAQASYMHSLAVSGNFAVVMADPLFINTVKVVRDVVPLDALEWVPSQPTRLLIVDLNTLETHEASVAPRVHMHHINSRDEHGLLTIDYVAYHDVNFLQSMTLKNLKHKRNRNKIQPKSRIVRYNIDVRAGVARQVALPGEGSVANALDFPTINEQFRHKPYCFAYGMVLMADGKNLENTLLAKKDLCSGRDLFWQRENEFASEAIFVPDPALTDEDSGVLLTLVLNGTSGKSYLAVIDARNMLTLNQLQLPDFVPFTLHGEFLPREVEWRNGTEKPDEARPKNDSHESAVVPSKGNQRIFEAFFVGVTVIWIRCHSIIFQNFT